MTKIDYTDLAEDRLLADYSDAACEHGAATANGQYVRANHAHDRVVAIYQELRGRGRDSWSRLLELDQYPDPAVQAWSAVHTLEISPDAAEKLLEQVASSTASLTQLAAQITLDEWRNGTLVIPGCAAGKSKGSLTSGDLTGSRHPEGGRAMEVPVTSPERLVRELPRQLQWVDVTEAARFDERFGAVNVVAGPIMDVSREGVTLCTDDVPTIDELLAWAWLVRPDLATHLRNIASHELLEAIDYYAESGG